MRYTYLTKAIELAAKTLGIFLILRFLTNLTQSDSFVITLIIMCIIILFEVSCGSMPNSNTSEEHMVNIHPAPEIGGTIPAPAPDNEFCSSVCGIKPPAQAQTANSSNGTCSTENINKMIDDKLSKIDNQILNLIKMKYEQDINKYNNNPQIARDGSRQVDGLINNDMKYDDYNHIPLLDSSQDDYGYSYLPPSQWYPTPPFPPVCVTEKECPVCPVNTTGTPLDMKEWDESRRIMPPDRINTSYVQKLNAGR